MGLIISADIFHDNRQIFSYTIDLYVCRFHAYGPEAPHAFERHAIMQHIANKIEHIVLVMNDAQELISDYMRASGFASG
jgi:hypothetical protein